MILGYSERYEVNIIWDTQWQNYGQTKVSETQIRVLEEQVIMSYVFKLLDS